MREWVRYVRDRERPLEAMHAHFERHTYHRQTYSFGVTELGAQAFTCRGGAHTSAAGMVMAFNPDEPHDGWAATPGGFTYRMLHIGPALLADQLADMTGRRADAPMFADPVLDDSVLAGRLRRLHTALTAPASPLQRDELLAATLSALARRGATRAPLHGPVPAAGREIAARVLAMLRDRFAEPLSADDLAEAAGCSRFTVYRAFTAANELAPSEYQRQLRLRHARRLLVTGQPPAEAAARTGFADQAHLTRWFVRSFGVTPGAFARAG